MDITFIKDKGQWKIDWQNRDVYEYASRQGPTRKFENLEVRFFQEMSETEIEASSVVLKEANERLREELSPSDEPLIILFGFD